MFTVKLDVSSFKALTDKIKNLKKQIPAAAAIALNETGKEIVVALCDQMSKDFDRPTPYTLNSLFSTKATAQNLSVTILPREFAGKGTPAKNYLKPEIYGGDRHVKRFEKALRAQGILPKDMYAYPGKGATLDAYGNMSPSQIVQILSYFQAFGQQGYRANMQAAGYRRLARGGKSGFGFRYFAIHKKEAGRLPPGIWKSISARAGRGVASGVGNVVVPILIFGKKPTYRRRYRWHEVAQAKASQVWPVNFQKAMANL